ncbi:hypothetical protein HQ585_19275 [candidate division KSB1 bacterium]|nr:hypothetical protein [candidate division KSB1 bacterium]
MADQKQEMILALNRGQPFTAVPIWEFEFHPWNLFHKNSVIVGTAFQNLPSNQQDKVLHSNAEVMAVCEQIQTGEFKGEVRKENSNCMTSPFYFRPKAVQDPPCLEANVMLTLVDPETKRKVKYAKIEILLYGGKIKELDVTQGQVSFNMPVNAMLKISSPGLPKIHRSLYLDYPPHQQLIETFASGRWLEQNNWKEFMNPGQVPWEAFAFEETEEVLSNVNWTIEIQENKRDALWKEFESLF